MSNLNCSIKFTKVIGDCKTSILNQLKAHKYIDEQKKIINMAEYLSYEKRTNEKASKKLGRPVELIYTNKNSDVLVKYNTKRVFFNYDVAEEIDRLNIMEQLTEETFDPNIEENIITLEGDYIPNYEPPVYQDNVEKELQQSQQDLNNTISTIIEEDKKLEFREDELPFQKIPSVVKPGVSELFESNFLIFAEAKNAEEVITKLINNNVIEKKCS